MDLVGYLAKNSGVSAQVSGLRTRGGIKAAIDRMRSKRYGPSQGGYLLKVAPVLEQLISLGYTHVTTHLNRHTGYRALPPRLGLIAIQIYAV